MVSIGALRAYDFFSDFGDDEIAKLAQLGSEESYESNTYFFREDQKLDNLYLIVDGEVVISLGVPDLDISQPISAQVSGEAQRDEIAISTLSGGQVFGWSAIIPPHQATADARAITNCRVLSFDCIQLRKQFDDLPHLGYLLTQKAAQVTRDRLQAMRMQVLARL